jgi:lipoprotein-releasing system permease protein
MGIIVGAMALFVVLSVFSGLKVFSLSFTNEIDPDLKISSTRKSFDFAKTRNRNKGHCRHCLLYKIEERVLFTFDDKQVTYLKA